MFAIIETGGKQYRVNIGDVLDVERLNAEEGSTVELKALLTGEGAEIVADATKKKVVVFKYKAKKNVRKKQGHRQQYTRIKIDSIV